MDRTINYSPLFDTPTANEVAIYRRATRASRPAAQAEHVVRIVIGVLAAVIGVVVVFALVISAVISIAALATERFETVELLGVLPPLVVIAVSIVLATRALVTRRHEWRTRLVMSRFAAANGLLYEPISGAPSYPGAIFGIGASRQVTDHFRTTDGRYLDFGNYSYVTGSGKSRTTHQWGFLALHLDRALPHMVLDSRANNGLLGGTNLPAVFSREQVLSLEGDVDRYFTLYCPTEYERDALYIFTPDLLALLIDEASPCDVEIVDRWMLVYSARPFPLADAATYQRLLRIVTTVGAKTLSQSDRYVDERVGTFAANTVAPQGRRLRRSFSWVSVAIIAFAIVIWASGILSGGSG